MLYFVLLCILHFAWNVVSYNSYMGGDVQFYRLAANAFLLMACTLAGVFGLLAYARFLPENSSRKAVFFGLSLLNFLAATLKGSEFSCWSFIVATVASSYLALIAKPLGNWLFEVLPLTENDLKIIRGSSEQKPSETRLFLLSLAFLALQYMATQGMLRGFVHS